MAHDGSHARPRKRLVAKRGQVLHVSGYLLEVVSEHAVFFVEHLDPQLSFWFYRPPGDERTIVLTNKPR